MFSPTHVVVTVRHGRNLLPKSKSGVNDAYAIIEFNKEKFATATEKSNNPKWLTECTFALPTGGVFLESVPVTVSIYNKKHSKLGLESDDLVGLANIPLSALNASDCKERCRWYKLAGKKKDSKKERGEIEVAFKFVAKNIPLISVSEKKSPKVSKFVLTGGSKGGRRRSEDEDSGVGMPVGERKKSFIGKSCENLTELFHSKSSGKKSSSSSPVFAKQTSSARNSRRHLSVGNFADSSRAVSVEILHDNRHHQQQQADDDSSHDGKDPTQVRRSNSSGNKKANLQALASPKGKHARNRSMPDAGSLIVPPSSSYSTPAKKPQRQQASSSTPGLCVNGSHVYIAPSSPAVTGRQSLIEATNRNRSQSVVALNRLDSKSQPMKAFREEGGLTGVSPLATNEAQNKPSATPTSTTTTVSSVYKPRNHYRLDVKELMKVSTIPEDRRSSIELMSHEQLVSLATHQQRVISNKDEHIRELENYIDTLLLKVILVQPQILDKSCRVSSANR